MLPPINVSTCADDLMVLTELAGRTLAYAAQTRRKTLDPDDFEAKVEDGDLLMRRKPVREALERIMRLPQGQRKLLRTAFDNDVRFHERFDAADFDFAYRNLPAEAHDAGKKLLVIFYEDLNKSGYSNLAGQVLERLDGEVFESSFRDANKEVLVCPACLSELRLRNKNRSQVDREHFFPKSKYPPLAVHPYNLTLACMACNGRVHLDTDPIQEHGAGALRDCFMPYLRPGIGEVEIAFGLGAEGYTAKLTGRAAVAGATRRAEYFDKMYSISEYWTGMLRTILDDLLLEVCQRLNYDVPNLSALDDEELRRRIGRELDYNVRSWDDNKFRQPGAFIRGRFANWIMTEKLDIAVGEISKRLREGSSCHSPA